MKKKQVKDSKFTTISLLKETVEKLQKLGSKTDTYEDIVQKLLKAWQVFDTYIPKETSEKR